MSKFCGRQVEGQSLIGKKDFNRGSEAWSTAATEPGLNT